MSKLSLFWLHFNYMLHYTFCVLAWVGLILGSLYGLVVLMVWAQGAFGFMGVMGAIIIFAVYACVVIALLQTLFWKP